jgi:hypothetical protein
MRKIYKFLWQNLLLRTLLHTPVPFFSNIEKQFSMISKEKTFFSINRNSISAKKVMEP